MLRAEMKEIGGAQRVGLHQRVRRRDEVDPDPDEGRGRAGADHPGAARRRAGGARSRAPWMSGSPPGDRSPSSRSSSIAGSPARSASPSDRWRSRCGPAFAGIDAGDWVDPSGETRDVTVRLAPDARERVTDLAQLPLVVGTDADGVPATLPLGQVATIRQGVGPAQIDHLDRDKVVIIQANVAGRPLTQVTQDITGHAGQARLCHRDTRSPTAASRRTRRRCSPGSSPRWAWRCC